ncbi:TetR/AcrR family transcriptional regulator [Actinopolymorpha alba]|uniref:TetR/AcrR family transcriptional regulator n=1 Tax=Actinopolymorpha alba TaxID=533267 RepID=UPI0003658696|nr:TetR/AcrR family transcriptional regulator [Actinopolymorpha alba]
MKGDQRGEEGPRPRRRQARGERRMVEILDASAGVFARVGYEHATTNAIAAAAGISPGSLYQFFPNKEAIAQALADRFAVQMRAAHEDAFDSIDFASLTFHELLDQVVDPIVAFNLANPGFKAIFARPDMPAGLASAAQPIQAALLGRVEALIASRAPGLPPDERARTARVSVQIFQAMVPMVVAVDEDERPKVIGELKKVLSGYLAPIIG